MYFVSLHGHGTSAWPGSSGAPIECSAFTKKPSSPILSSAAWPIRVIVRIETTTYSESVISTPSLGSSAPSGPMQNGTTHSVRPRIDPRYRSFIRIRISAGSIQLFVGPASISRCEQMKVRDSTRATSDGSDSARYEFGCFSSFSLLEGSGLDEVCRQPFVFFVGAVREHHSVGLC